jgi:hypothetical protein
MTMIAGLWNYFAWVGRWVLVPVRAETSVQLTLMRFIVVVLILADDSLRATRL